MSDEFLADNLKVLVYLARTAVALCADDDRCIGAIMKATNGTASSKKLRELVDIERATKYRNDHATKS